MSRDCNLECFINKLVVLIDTISTTFLYQIPVLLELLPMKADGQLISGAKLWKILLSSRIFLTNI